MDPILSQDRAEFTALLAATLRHATEYVEGLDTAPAVAPVTTPEPEPLPERGYGLAGALDAFARRWAPGFSASAGPRYLGFVTGGATPAAVAGDWLTSVCDQNAAGDGRSSANALERHTTAWLAELLGLDPAFSGSFVTGATMSNMVGLAIAREWLGERMGVSVAEAGVAALGAVTVLSGTPHSSVYKALSMLGLGRDSLRVVPTLRDREAVDPTALRAELESLGGRPAVVVANAGTVNTADFDDLTAVAALRREYPFWLHVDAAFGGFAAVSPTYAHLVNGLDQADSVCVDLHKWLNVPYDSAVQFTRRRDLQTRVFQNHAAYLGDPGDSPDFLHLTPENSRRLRALAAWFTLTAYGRQGHREIVERNISAAHRLGELLTASPRMRLLAPVGLHTVCFTLAENPTEARIAAVLRSVAESAETFLTPTHHLEIPAIRGAFSNWRTTTADVDRIAAAVRQAVDDLS
ncbi:glutamate/tyrosine decarboxylase-like PLP-dependent enzyme [Stackebrandtia albiflava]|uniref:Glutamate/tyrosine decarboxylase-like PLP-dependent enzyme n=1 Tax=Stackebrandtia albiflava TaxID=406432 RepID=A0A562VCJ4_9ACTN|nr:pyridoxal-dependent decarboxylase [Stackebrandtia albiflava]TWJ15547.1 glutamate/tyrosine decarboxylase-like PLP-dependent enzyme [Stackebrandtia albiflava]